jgi:hypothetical protein
MLKKQSIPHFIYAPPGRLASSFQDIKSQF